MLARCGRGLLIDRSGSCCVSDTPSARGRTAQPSGLDALASTTQPRMVAPEIGIRALRAFSASTPRLRLLRLRRGWPERGHCTVRPDLQQKTHSRRVALAATNTGEQTVASDGAFLCTSTESRESLSDC